MRRAEIFPEQYALFVGGAGQIRQILQAKSTVKIRNYSVCCVVKEDGQMAEITVIPAKNRTDEIIRTAAYARVSSDSEDQLNSFATQIRYYTELLNGSTDMVFVEMYADEGISGTSAAKRADFQRLMSDCRKGKIDRILTKSVTEFPT